MICNLFGEITVEDANILVTAGWVASVLVRVMIWSGCCRWSTLCWWSSCCRWNTCCRWSSCCRCRRCNRCCLEKLDKMKET
jgi:hypothetical protein